MKKIIVFGASGDTGRYFMEYFKTSSLYSLIAELAEESPPVDPCCAAPTITTTRIITITPLNRIATEEQPSPAKILLIRFINNCEVLADVFTLILCTASV